MCVSPRQLVSWLGSLSPPEKERERSSAMTEEPRWLSQCPLPPPSAASPRVGACLLRCPSFFAKWRVMMMDAVCRPPQCIPASLCLPWLHEAASSEPWQAVHIIAQWRVLKPETLASVWWARIRALTCSLLVMWVSLGEWICRILLGQRKKVIHFYMNLCTSFRSL